MKKLLMITLSLSMGLFAVDAKSSSELSPEEQKNQTIAYLILQIYYEQCKPNELLCAYTGAHELSVSEVEKAMESENGPEEVLQAIDPENVTKGETYSETVVTNKDQETSPLPTMFNAFKRIYKACKDAKNEHCVFVLSESEEGNEVSYTLTFDGYNSK